MKTRPRDFNLNPDTILEVLGAENYDKIEVDIQMVKLNIEEVVKKTQKNWHEHEMDKLYGLIKR